MNRPYCSSGSCDITNVPLPCIKPTLSLAIDGLSMQFSPQPFLVLLGGSENEDYFDKSYSLKTREYAFCSGESSSMPAFVEVGKPRPL